MGIAALRPSPHWQDWKSSMEAERYFAGEIAVILADGSRVPARATADEIIRDGKEVYRLSLERSGEIRTIESHVDFFETLIRLRLELETEGALLWCFGASEDVYPSGMQRSMGPAILAYRMRMGYPTLQRDIVNIFEADDMVIPSTVARQQRYHQAWFESLRAR